LLQQERQGSTKEFTDSVRKSINEQVNPNADSVTKGKQFLRWAVTKLFNASEDDFDQHYTDGKDDHGIDFWIPDPSDEKEGGIIQLFQLKYGESHKPEKIGKFQDDIDDFFKMKLQNVEREALKDVMREKIQRKLELELIYVTDQEIEDPDKYKDVKVYGFQQIVEKLWEDIFGKPKGQVTKLKLEDYMPYNHCIIGVASLVDVGKFVRRNKSYIFESNIRKFLGSRKTKVNKQLQKTINEDPENFFKYNNGITMVSTKFKELGEKEIELVEPQIVNGAQTAKTIAQEIEIFDEVKGSVPITIIQEETREVKNKITRWRNSQNAVKGKDLISLEDTHQNLHAQFTTVGYYYEHQAGGWLSLSDNEKKRFTGHPIYNKYLEENNVTVIGAKDAIQAMVAGIMQEPTKPYGSVARYMPGGANYHEVFNNDLTEDWRLFLYPYLVKVYCWKKFNYGKQIADRPEMKYARLLFVTAYFRILSKFLIEKDFDKITKNPELLEPYFKDFDTNARLLQFTDEMLQHYFANAYAFQEEHKDITWHNFFSRYAWDEPLQKDFMHYVVVNKPKLKEIKNDFKKQAFSPH